jgi:hypothetical protein
MDNSAINPVSPSTTEQFPAAPDRKLRELLKRLSSASPNALSAVLEYWLGSTAPGDSRVES